MKKLVLFMTVLLCTAALAQDPAAPNPAGQEPPPAEAVSQPEAQPEPKAEPAPAPKPVLVPEEFRSQLISATFEPTGTQLTPASAAALDSVAALLMKDKNNRYEVHGHTSADAEAQNRAMRFTRVETIVDYLQAKGVPTKNIITIVNPPSSDTKADGCTHDRRVDIMLIETRMVEAKPEPKPEPVAVPEPVVIPEPAPTPEPVVIPTPIHTPEAEIAAAQGKQAVAVYMAGNEPEGARGVHNIMGGELARILSESDKYLAVDRTDAILEQLAREHTYQRSGAVDDEQIKVLGQQLGVQYLCISDINPAGKRSYYFDVRLVDVVTAEIIRTATATSNLKNANEMTTVARNIALELLETEKAIAQQKRRKKIFRYTAIGLDILGAGALAYGYYENNNIINLNKGGEYPDAVRVAERRNAAYIVGGALLATGVTIHILF